MTYVTAEPQLIAAAAADVGAIGSDINAANAAAALPTSGLLAPAADEVSAAITKLFDLYGLEHQAVAAQAAAFHGQFTAALAAAGGAYAAAEAAASKALGTLRAGTASTAMSASPSMAADPRFDVALVMGGTGVPIPAPRDIDGVLKWATQGNFSWTTAQGVFTPEGLYPLTDVRSLPLSTSVSQGVQILDATIKQEFAAGNSVLVVGYSQSSVIASLEMENLLASGNPPTHAQLGFNLLGDPMNPNGGLLARFPGLNFPSLGLDFYGATPANTPWTTNIFTLEYDGFADFPRYPIDLLSDLNAIAGIHYVHTKYSHIDPTTLPPGDIVQLPVQPTYTGPLANTTYYMVLTPNLPLLDPLRAIPVIGNPLADLLQPDMTYLVNWGYRNPNYGYSTAPANVPTPFGLFPPLNATTALGPDLINDTQQGISNATSDIVVQGHSSPSGPSLRSLSPSGIPHSPRSIPLPSPGTLPSPTSIHGAVESLLAANTNIVGAFSKAASDASSVLLPTADVINGAVISVPAYDVSLFIDGIAQAVGGDPVGLIHAIGDPIVADVGLLTLMGGIEVLFLGTAAGDMVRDFTSPTP